MRAALAILFASGVAPADPPRSPSTDVRFREPGRPQPQVSAADMAWFAGTWEGEVFGNAVEHVVLPARGGQMPGLVRIIGDGQVSLYELSSFIERDGSITYRNRHFGRELDARQDRRDWVDRPLVARDGDTFYFDGITFAPDGASRAVVSFVLRDADGRSHKHVVRYRRTTPPVR
ncbi:DUF6265 family protein [Sphingomonas lenta]|nr:DUF6265 family protein [Sphingomonas lenta]